MAYGLYKDVEKTKQSDKVLKDKAFEIANNPKDDGSQGDLAHCFRSFLIKNQKEVVLKMKLKKNQQLDEQLHKPINRKFRRRKVCCCFKDNTLCVGLADIHLMSKI